MSARLRRALILMPLALALTAGCSRPAIRTQVLICPPEPPPLVCPPRPPKTTLRELLDAHNECVAAAAVWTAAWRACAIDE